MSRSASETNFESYTHMHTFAVRSEIPPGILSLQCIAYHMCVLVCVCVCTRLQRDDKDSYLISFPRDPKVPPALRLSIAHVHRECICLYVCTRQGDMFMARLGPHKLGQYLYNPFPACTHTHNLYGALGERAFCGRPHWKITCS